MAFSQLQIDWINLADVTFTEKKTEDGFITYNEATFGESLQQLDSQMVTITGYIIPMDPMGITYVLSRNPNATCFFCGGAGPETVLQLNPKVAGVRRYQTDTKMTFKGRLKMNKKDIDSLTFELEEAEEM
ncbi:MAG: DUF3299 domain-containing protein [Bacteroidota bacterium]